MNCYTYLFTLPKLTAVYAGDDSRNAGTSAVLACTIAKDATHTELTLPQLTITVGDNPVLTATVSAPLAPLAPLAPTGTVTFFDGTRSLGTATLSGGAATFQRSTPWTVGTHTVKAVYAGDMDSLGSTSLLLQLVVLPSVHV